MGCDIEKEGYPQNHKEYFQHLQLTTSWNRKAEVNKREVNEGSYNKNGKGENVLHLYSVQKRGDHEVYTRDQHDEGDKDWDLQKNKTEK